MTSPSPSTGQGFRGPFVASQRLLVLKCEPGRELDFLQPEDFRLRGLNERDCIDDAEQAALEDWRRGWDLVPDREVFLADASIRLLCLTTGGGIGKTTAARQVAYLRPLADPGQLASAAGGGGRPVGAEAAERIWAVPLARERLGVDWELVPRRSGIDRGNRTHV